MLKNNRLRQGRLHMVELVGPAGAGKTTLSRVLVHGSEKVVVAADISLRKKEYLLLFLKNFSSVLPLLVGSGRPDRSFTWDEVKAMIYLKESPSALRREATNGHTIILLDHGPIFKLATLYAFGPERLKSEAFETWWSDMFRQWAFLLDMIVWLDAPDSILEERINSRPQRHAVKGKSQAEVREFLERYRSSYQKMLTKLVADGGPTLCQFDTSQNSLEQIAEMVRNACRRETIGI